MSLCEISSSSRFMGQKVKLGNHGAPFQNIETLQFSPSAEDFYERYARQSRPVLIKNAVRKWPAFYKWPNLTYMHRYYGNELFNVELRKKFQTSFPIRKTLSLSKFIDEFEDSDIYLDSLFSKDSYMLNDVHLPTPLDCAHRSIAIDNLNLLISSGNTSSAFHQDGYENLLSVLSGVKEVILYNNNYTRAFNADEYKIAAGVSDIDPEGIDLDEHIVFAKTPYQIAKLQPGDMLYIPKYWWHHVRSYSNPNIAVGMWFDIFNFDKEMESQYLDDTEQVVKTTEAFIELLDKEPLKIHCLKNGFVAEY
eukprot:gene12250-2885_t